METYTIREAAELCGMTYEALRARVDRGTIRAGKRREDAARLIPKSELQRTGLLPGADMAKLLVEVDRLRVELKSHRLLTERAQSATAAERHARDLAEQALHQERALRLEAEAKAAEDAHAAEELREREARLAQGGFFERRRLLRELRAVQTA